MNISTTVVSVFIVVTEQNTNHCTKRATDRFNQVRRNSWSYWVTPPVSCYPSPYQPAAARALSPLLLPPPASRRGCLKRWTSLFLTSICLLSTCVFALCPPSEFDLHYIPRVFLGRYLICTSAETPRRRVFVKRSNLRLRKHFRWIIQLSKCVSKHDY